VTRFDNETTDPTATIINNGELDIASPYWVCLNDIPTNPPIFKPKRGDIHNQRFKFLENRVRILVLPEQLATTSDSPAMTDVNFKDFFMSFSPAQKSR
jgi:P pilus assembly chaperone PapD